MQRVGVWLSGSGQLLRGGALTVSSKLPLAKLLMPQHMHSTDASWPRSLRRSLPVFVLQAMILVSEEPVRMTYWLAMMDQIVLWMCVCAGWV